MENKYDCDAYDNGYCYVLARPLTDEEDDMCDNCCCAKNNTYMDDIYYIVGIKDKYKDRLSCTTINKEFCGKFNHQAYGVAWFELNGSGAYVAVPDEWIEYIAPSKVLWNK